MLTTGPLRFCRSSCTRPPQRGGVRRGQPPALLPSCSTRPAPLKRRPTYDDHFSCLSWISCISWRWS